MGSSIGIKGPKLWFSYMALQLKLTMNFLAFGQLSQARFCPLVVLYEISPCLNTVVNNIHIMNV